MQLRVTRLESAGTAKKGEAAGQGFLLAPPAVARGGGRRVLGGGGEDGDGVGGRQEEEAASPASCCSIAGRQGTLYAAPGALCHNSATIAHTCSNVFQTAWGKNAAGLACITSWFVTGP